MTGISTTAGPPGDGGGGGDGIFSTILGRFKSQHGAAGNGNDTDIGNDILIGNKKNETKKNKEEVLTAGTAGAGGGNGNNLLNNLNNSTDQYTNDNFGTNQYQYRHHVDDNIKYMRERISHLQDEQNSSQQQNDNNNNNNNNDNNKKKKDNTQEDDEQNIKKNKKKNNKPLVKRRKIVDRQPGYMTFGVFFLLIFNVVINTYLSLYIKGTEEEARDMQLNLSAAFFMVEFVKLIFCSCYSIFVTNQETLLVDIEEYEGQEDEDDDDLKMGTMVIAGGKKSYKGFFFFLDLVMIVSDSV